ncbi:MAG TPA: hypothetical protein VIF83_02780, partial [Gemmatimonadaceae bacterium]
GEKDSAEMEARKAMQLVPLSESAYAAPAFAGDAALIYAQTGNFDAAIDLLRLLLAMPAGREVSVPLLRVDPGWDPLRKDPRFESLLAQYSSN